MIIRFKRKKTSKTPSKTTKPTHRRPHWGRRILAVLVLSIIILTTAAGLYFTSDKKIQELSRDVLAGITGGQVKLSHAEFSNFSEIRIQGLRVHITAKTNSHSTENPILTTEDLLVRINPLKLLVGKFQVEEIVILEGQLKIWYDRDKGISNLDLLDFGEESGEPMVLPALYFRNCVLEYTEITNGVRGPKAKQEITGKVFPFSKNSSGYSFQFNSGETSLLKQASLVGFFDISGKIQPNAQLTFQLENVQLDDLPSYFDYLKQGYKKTDPFGKVIMNWTFAPTSGPNLELILENGVARLPLPELNAHLQNINATIHLQNDIIEVENLRGELKNHFSVYMQGTLFGYDENMALDLTARTEGLKVPLHQWDDASDTTEPSEFLRQLVNLMPLKIRRVIESLSPTGTMDIELQAKREAGKTHPVKYYGTVQCHSTNMIYEKFPYPLYDLSGTVRFDPNEVVVGPMISWKDGMELIYEGRWQKEVGKPSFEMSVRIKNGTVDDLLYQALDSKQKAIWEQFNPKNNINATYHIQRKVNKQPRWGLEVELLNIDATYQGIAIPLTEIHGTLTMSHDRTEIQIDSARAKGGTVSLTGHYQHPLEDQKTFKGDVQFSDVTIDEEFFSYFSENIRQRYEQLEIRGQCSGQVKINPSCPNPADGRLQLDYTVEAQLKEGSVNYTYLDYPLDHVEAQVNLSREHITVKSLTGEHESSRIYLEGQITDPNHYQLYLEAIDLVLDTPLRQVVNTFNPDLWKLVHPKGKVNLSLEIGRTNDMATPQITGKIEPTNASFQLENIQYPFKNVSGTILIEPNQIIFNEILSQTGPGTFVFSGQWPLNQLEPLELHFSGKNVPIDEQFLSTLPEPLRNYFAEIQLTGRLETDMNISTLNPRKKNGLWKIDGWLKLNEGKLTKPMASEAIHALWKGKLSYEPDTKILRADGELRNGSVLIQKRPLDNVQAQIRYDSENNLLSVSNIAGQLCDGQLGGQARLFFPQSGPGYELQLAVREVDLKLLLEADKAPQDRKKKLQGQLEGEYNLQKKDSDSMRTGFFQFNIDDATLGELPVAVSLLHVPNLSLPKEGAFNEVNISGNIIGQVVRFDSLFLKGSAMSLQGVGEMTEPGHNLDLIFIVGSPHDLPPIPGFTDLFTAIKPAILHLRVTGSFEEPKVDTIAFSAFRKLLQYFAGISSYLPLTP